MNRSKFRCFTFLLLFAFCGQTLAMPFLDCCDEMSQSSAMMDSSSQQMDMPHDHGSMLENAGLDDCSHLCNFCFATASLLIPDFGEHTLAAEVFTRFSHYQFSPLPSNSFGPFRPPIFS